MTDEKTLERNSKGDISPQGVPVVVYIAVVANTVATAAFVANVGIGWIAVVGPKPMNE